MRIMGTRLRAIARDTAGIVRGGGYTAPDGRRVHLADDGAHAVANTRLHLPEEDLAAARGDAEAGPGMPDLPPRSEVSGCGSSSGTCPRPS
ncbi:hypothetical protein GCM10010466_57930 [Planomonospora alba]|uniref:Uncharacterized protein n=1 Tax=Planomonospora alba TaxID=161354 RepID=A0ABP6NWP1_9ACTN